MRHGYLVLAVGMLLSGWPNSAGAQTSAPMPVGDFQALRTEGTGTAVPSPLPVDVPKDVPWSVDLLVGFPTGVRGQHALGAEAGRDWLIEGFAGLELIFPMAGVGIRRRFTPLCGAKDALVISPGVDAYLLYNTLHDGGGWFSGGPATAQLVAADVEILWQHALRDRCSGQLGVKLGAGAAFGNREVTVPIVGLIFGFRF